MKRIAKITFLLCIITLLLACVRMYPDITPEIISPAELTASPANSEADIEAAKQVASQLIKACQENDLEASRNFHTPERIKRQDELVIAPHGKWCISEKNVTDIVLAQQYPYGQAIYFLYTYTSLDASTSKNKKYVYYLEMMKTKDGTWLANRNGGSDAKNDLAGQLYDCVIYWNKK